MPLLPARILGILPAMPLFTRDTAPQLSAKAAEGRRRASAARRQALADALSKIDELQAALAAIQADASARCNGDFASDRLERVRAHLARIDEALKTEKDPLSIERLARASQALHVQEFALAGRPMPGSLRPTAAAARRTIDYRGTLSAPASPAPVAPVNPFRRAG